MAHVLLIGDLHFVRPEWEEMENVKSIVKLVVRDKPSGLIEGHS